MYIYLNCLPCGVHNISGRAIIGLYIYSFPLVLSAFLSQHLNDEIVLDQFPTLPLPESVFYLLQFQDLFAVILLFLLQFQSLPPFFLKVQRREEEDLQLYLNSFCSHSYSRKDQTVCWKVTFYWYEIASIHVLDSQTFSFHNEISPEAPLFSIIYPQNVDISPWPHTWVNVKGFPFQPA